VESEGNILEFLFISKRIASLGQRLLLESSHIVTVDTNTAYPGTFKEFKAESVILGSCKLRQSTYFNNLAEQDHHFIKRLVVRDHIMNLEWK